MFKTNVTYRDIWKIAYPIIIGSIAQNLLNITDTAFLGRVGEIELGAGAIGGVYYFAIIMLGWGFGIGTQIIVARRNGEKDFSSIGKTIDHGLYFMIPLAILMFSLMKFLSDDFLFVMMDSGEVKQATSEYINFRAFGLFFAFINFLFRAFYVGLGKTNVITYSTTLLAIVNGILDYCLIFGNFGFPEMGIAGAALASVIAEASALMFFIIYTRFSFDTKPYHLFHFSHFDLKLYMRIIRVSLPMMGQNFLSLATWLVFFLLVEKMGERQLAISNIIRSFYFVLMMPMWGFASATNTLVSFLIGAKRDDEVMSLVYKVMIMCLSSVGLMVVLGMIFPHEVVRIYTNEEALMKAALPVVYVVSLAALMLSSTFIFFNAVSGTGRTLTSFVFEVITLTFYLSYIWFIIMVYQGNISTVWTSEWVYAGLLGSMSFIYLKSGKWRGSEV